MMSDSIQLPAQLPAQRFDHIDIAKGISMLLVALHHSYLSDLATDLLFKISVFRMPLFFFMSGVFFSYAANYRPFIAKRAGALLKPYLVIALAVTLGLYLAEGVYQYRLFRFMYTNGTIIGWPWTPLWFLPHLFAVHLFGYILNRHTPYEKLSIRSKWIVLFAMLVAGLFVVHFYSRPIIFHLAGTYVHVWGLPFSADVVLVSSAYFLAGSLLKEQVKAFEFNAYKFILALAGLGAIFLFFEVKIDLVMRSVDSHLFAIIGSVLGIYIVVGLSKLIEKTNWLKKMCLAVGGASLFILLFHVYIETQLLTFFQIEDWATAPRIAASLLFFLLCVGIPIGMKWVVQRNMVLSLIMLPKAQRRSVSERKAKAYPA